MEKLDIWLERQLIYFKKKKKKKIKIKKQKKKEYYLFDFIIFRSVLCGQG